VKKIKDPIFDRRSALPLQLADASREGIQHYQEREKVPKNSARKMYVHMERHRRQP
jgi:hypothetical protein